MPSTILIAELCHNHNGSKDLLWRLLDAAALAGATHVKLQSIFARNLTERPEFEHGVVKNGRTLAIHRPYDQEFERLSALDLDLQVYEEFVRRAKDYGVTPMTTCFTRGQISMIVDQGFGSVKVASYDCASYQLLRELKDKFGEIVISTGSTFDDEVQHASLVMKGHPNWSFLHCVTLYPTPISKLNLGRLAFLRDLAPRVGYSDHSSPTETGLIASMVACALGASLLERHFTILPPDATRDGVVSVTPKQFRELSAFAKLSHESQHEELLSRGIDTQDYLLPSDQTLSYDELLNRNYYRGRFATPRHGETTSRKCGIYNWEETKID